MTATEVELLLSKMSDTFRSIASVCAYAGLRISEALGLRWRDVDLNAGTITVAGQLDAVGGLTYTERCKPQSRRNALWAVYAAGDTAVSTVRALARSDCTTCATRWLRSLSRTAPLCRRSPSSRARLAERDAGDLRREGELSTGIR